MPDMEGRTAVVFGGTGTVGEGVVRALLAGGATVAVPSRSPASLQALRDRLGAAADGRVTGLVGDAATAEGAGALRAEAERALGPADAVVASINGPASMNTPLLETEPEAWQAAVDGTLTPHFHAARGFLPALADRKGASYTAITGGLAVQPMAGTGTAAVPGAGVTAMMRLLFKELRDRAVRLNAVMIHSIVTPGATPDTRHPERTTAREVGDFTAWLASGRGAMVRNAVLDLHPPRPRAQR